MKAIMPRRPRPRRARQRARRLRREGAPRRPAGARRGGQGASTTRSPRRASSSSSTARTPTSSPPCSTPRTRRCASATAPAAQPVHAGRRARADDGHRRHGVRPRERDEQPQPARRTLGPLIAAAFLATLIGVGSANVVFLPDGQPPQGALRGGDALPRDDARGHPRHPGRRQPARRRGEAHGLRPAGRAPDRGGAGRGGRGGRSRRPEADP